MTLDNGKRIPFEELSEDDFLEQKVPRISQESALAISLADRMAEEFLVIISDCSVTGNTLTFEQMRKILAGMFRAFGEGMVKGHVIHEVSEKMNDKPITLKELKNSLEKLDASELLDDK